MIHIKFRFSRFGGFGAQHLPLNTIQYNARTITASHGNAYTVVRATSYSYGELQTWRYQNSKTPEPIVTEN